MGKLRNILNAYLIYLIKYKAVAAWRIPWTEETDGL